jgi:hypothetical protein
MMNFNQNQSLFLSEIVEDHKCFPLQTIERKLNVILPLDKLFKVTFCLKVISVKEENNLVKYLVQLSVSVLSLLRMVYNILPVYVSKHN